MNVEVFLEDAAADLPTSLVESLGVCVLRVCPEAQRLVVHFSGHAYYGYEGVWYMLATASGEGMEDVLLRDMGGHCSCFDWDDASNLEPTRWADELTWLDSRDQWNFPLAGDPVEVARLVAFLESRVEA